MLSCELSWLSGCVGVWVRAIMRAIVCACVLLCYHAIVLSCYRLSCVLSCNCACFDWPITLLVVIYTLQFKPLDVLSLRVHVTSKHVTAGMCPPIAEALVRQCAANRNCVVHTAFIASATSEAFTAKSMIGQPKHAQLCD